MAERQEHVAVRGAQLWTATTGHGPPVVLAHGGPGLSDNLGPVAELVDDLATVHRYDQRACGRSTGAAEGQTVASTVQDLDDLRDHWGHDRWVVGGHSWGAALALSYALTHPERVAALVLVSSPGLPDPQVRPVARSRAERLSAAERHLLPELEQRAGQGDADAARSLAHLYWKTDFSDPSRAPDPAVHPLYACPRNTSVARLLQESATQAAAAPGRLDRLRALHLPVLVLHGRDDPLPVEHAVALAEQLPTADLQVLDGVGHVPWLEDLLGTRTALRRFLTRVHAEACD